MIRVGIVFMLNDNWLGGINYYRNLINAVYCTPDRQIEFVIITDSDVAKLKDFQHLEIIKTQLFERFSVAWFLRKISIKLFKNDFLLSQLLRKNNINVLSHSGWLSKSSKIPTVGWIPDFQHIHLPKFFTENELKLRDKAFSEICNFCTKVIVSSNDALKDLQAFAPNAANKAIVMQFAVPPKKPNTKLIPLDVLKSRYNFDEPFYLLPNQFWAHKNHKIVIEALAILKKQNYKITVLATGNTSDHRQPNFFSSLEKLIESSDVKDDFKVLGMIPQNDLEVLFHYACAIINPSLFEGWSTTVEEAKTLGKKVILSDIAIHREQKPRFGAYFEPNDANKLACLLKEYVDINHVSELNINEVEEAFINYGVTYQNIVNNVVHKG